MNVWDRLRTTLRAVREYPNLIVNLDAAHSELQQAQRALKHNEQKYDFLNRQMEEQNHALKFHSQQSRAFQTALFEFCPSLSSTEDMKRFYDTISPILDAQGFTLYHMAEQMTGIDVPSFFPYEDNRGMFTEMNGRQLLHWLTAAHFHAVEWEIVTGSCYEKAVLQEVNTSTPEYQAFEQKLCRAVLTRMGFEDLLGPKEPIKSQEKEVIATEEKTTELKLYSPLSAQLYEKEPEDEDDDRPMDLDGGDLTVFQNAIRQGIQDEELPDEAERGLMTYFDGSKAVDEKVVSCFPNVEEIDGRLYGVAVCQVKDRLSPGELDELKEYCTGQYADGWGEGYEQRPRKTEYGELYVSFWQRDSFFICTGEEMEAVKAPARSRPQVQRGGER